MANWAKDNTFRPKGISEDILVSGGKWKRADGFGHMSDEEVHRYKMHPGRRDRYRDYQDAHTVDEVFE